MKQLYANWMNNWETQLCFRSTNRVVRPFDWGLEWTRQWPVAQRYPQNGHSPDGYLKKLSDLAIEHSDEFFAYRTPTDFRLEGNLVKFTSAVESPYAENNVVHGQWFPPRNGRGARGSFERKTAVIVIPHWNASVGQHVGLAKGIAAFGMAAVRLSLPYHDFRMPGELQRADYAVSSNVARTIDATRQAVIDIRSMADWFQSQGYERVAIVGTSLGSCYGYLASAHDPRFEVNVYNHCSTYFADVVWEGLSTQHIKKSLDGNVELETLRDCWLAISPPAYQAKYAAHKKKSLFMYAQYDTTFPLHLSKKVIEQARESGLDHKEVVLPCGHYTEGESPFKYMVGYHIISYLKRHL